MLLSRKTLAATLVMVLAVTVLGCSGGPTPLTAPLIQVEEAADAAFSQYDKDGDGQLNEEELSNCPALRDAMTNRIDKNKDQQLSREELAERFSMWVNGGVGLTSFMCRVTLKGKSLDGVQVQLVPEEFLGDVIQPAVGTTDKSGLAQLAIDPSHQPADLQDFPAVQQGHYRVQITHPSIEIPPKYNIETILGIEISAERARGLVSFKL